ncbi:hypothetical protein OS493_037224 [Desmophyllum pertusum]|uniref:Uncharacterized protein n=1 Tax=Desmophyllum pertusum TaxID=174260 RepID=A0A9X0D879_9CNID|nr:hypothetical protein OS493_037224 [Desmophyllum pertusum]
MSQRMEMQLKGKALVNITGKALKKYFSLNFGSTAVTGKAVLGAYVRPTRTEPVRLAILASLSGGRQNKILNIGEVKLFLNYLNCIVPELQNVLREANLILPEGQVVLKGSLQMMQHLNDLMQEIDLVVADKRINGTNVLTLLHQINRKIEYMKKIIDLINRTVSLIERQRHLCRAVTI